MVDFFGLTMAKDITAFLELCLVSQQVCDPKGSKKRVPFDSLASCNCYESKDLCGFHWSDEDLKL